MSELAQTRQIQAVLFDLDDTLIDWSQRTMSSGELLQRHMGRVYDFLHTAAHPMPARDDFFACYKEKVAAHWAAAKQTWSGVNFGEVLLDSFAACGLDPAAIDLDAVLSAYAWQPVPGIKPYDDTLEVLDTLKQQGYKIGLITNSMQPMWMRDVELEAYGILPYLDARVTSGDLGYMKPHPHIYQHLLDKLQTTAVHALFVGDRPENDIVGANKVGLVSVWMNPPHLERPLNGVQPDYTITRLRELFPILAELNGDQEDKI